MSNKEIVQQGLDARKNVKAAEARAERYREDLAEVENARFYDQIQWRATKANWLREQEILNGVINRQRETIYRLREEVQELHREGRKTQRRLAMISCIKSAFLSLATICAMNLGWLASNLAASILIGALFCTIYAIYKLARNK